MGIWRSWKVSVLRAHTPLRSVGREGVGMHSGSGSGEPAAESRGGVWAAQDGLAVEDPRSVCWAQGTGASIPSPYWYLPIWGAVGAALVSFRGLVGDQCA